MTPKHSQAPWTVHGTMVFGGNKPDVGAYAVAQTFLTDERNEPLCSDREQEANASLIAAAPDMDALLREALDAWPQFDTDDDVNGGDMVDWFGQWRVRVKEALSAGGAS